MSAYQIDDLIAKWKLAELTPEQAIGQILLLLQAVVERLEIVEQQIGRQRNALRANNTPRH